MSDLVGQHCQYLIDDRDELLSGRMANNFAVESEYFFEQRACTKLEELLVHGGVQLTFLNFKSFYGGFEELELTIGSLCEGIYLTWSKHDIFLRLLLLLYRLRQDLVEQSGELVNEGRLVLVFFWKKLRKHMKGLPLQDIRNHKMREFTAMAQNAQKHRNSLLRIRGLLRLRIISCHVGVDKAVFAYVHDYICCFGALICARYCGRVFADAACHSVYQPNIDKVLIFTGELVKTL